MPQQIHSFRDVLALAGVRRLWIGQLVSIAGDFLAIFAVLSIASFRLHGTAAQITGVTIAYMLPLAIVGPLAGVLVDRWNPRRTMIASDLTRAVLALLLAFCSSFSEIYAILFAISTVSTFFIPAQSVIVRTLVPREGLLTVNTLMQHAMLIIRIISPALAAALVSRLGPNSCFGLDTASFLFSALMLAGIASPNEPTTATTRVNTVLTDLFAGIRFILTHPGISFVMLAMASATFAISCFSPLLAILVRDILHADVHTFGAISASVGLGMIAGTQGVRRLFLQPPPTPPRSPRHVVLVGLAVIAAGVLLIGVGATAVTTAIGAFVMGAGVGLLMVPAQTLIQSETPLPMLGRVSSGVMSLISVAQVLGLVLSGSSAAALGLRTLFFLSTAILASLALTGYCKLLREKTSSTLLTEVNSVN